MSCFFDSGFRQPFLKSSRTSVATHSAPSPPDFSSNARSIWIHMVHLMVKISQNCPKMVKKWTNSPRHSFGSFACEVCLSIFNGDGLEPPDKGPFVTRSFFGVEKTVRLRCEVRVHPQDVQHQTHLSHPCLLTARSEHLL